MKASASLSGRSIPVFLASFMTSETDGVFVYEVASSPNKIVVYDMKGNLLKQITCSAFSGEPESLCYDWINDIYYIEGINSIYVIRQAVFKN